MPQYFIDNILAVGSAVRITGDDFHHLARVRRVHPGDPISLRDASGVLYHGWIAQVNERDIVADVASVEK
ncbi:MAG: RNA methyltransferase PUA domain-containing protein, partial [Spirochaetota bacterium]